MTDARRAKLDSLADSTEKLRKSHDRLRDSLSGLPRDTYELTKRQRDGLRMILIRVGSWSSARYDQHLRYEIGDEDANAVIRWLERHGIDPYVSKP